MQCGEPDARIGYPDGRMFCDLTCLMQWQAETNYWRFCECGISEAYHGVEHRGKVYGCGNYRLAVSLRATCPHCGTIDSPIRFDTSAERDWHVVHEHPRTREAARIMAELRHPGGAS